MSRALVIAGRFLIAIPVVIIVMTAIGYLVGVNSSAMSFAEETLRQSEAVRQRVGEIKSMRLKLWGFSHESAYGGDLAKLDLVVMGSTGVADVEIKLKELDGHWTLVDVSTQVSE